VPYQVFPTTDGHVVIAVGNDAQYERFCTILQREDLASDPLYATNEMRLKNRQELIPILAAEIAKWKRDELVAALDEAGVPGGAINTIQDVFETDQVTARDMKIIMAHPDAGSVGVSLIGNPVKFSKSKISYRLAPPRCGEHTKEILTELAKWEKKQGQTT